MIDLHSHILPGIDDGSRSLEMSLDMARMAVADGIKVMACTPHIYPGLYMNDAAGIRAARDALQGSLNEHGIPLQLTTGADVHLVPGLLEGLREGRVPSLHGTRYLLLEPPHHVAPPHFAESVFNLVAAGYVPVITHPERLTWVEDHYQVFAELTRQGAWMQLTAGSLTGVFGARAKHWAERFLDDGLTHILATDAHSSGRRSPVMSQAREIAERMLGREEADLLVEGRQRQVLANALPSAVPPLPVRRKQGDGWLNRLLRRRH
ncbi:MAG: Tyrosine-protein phosphatase YwqE [Ramlibacter sp.]|nr:Tyrosine-protein phosphatase YwqE [Ramlibacter sp.]